jgi:hypothetical protein
MPRGDTACRVPTGSRNDPWMVECIQPNSLVGDLPSLWERKYQRSVRLPAGRTFSPRESCLPGSRSMAGSGEREKYQRLFPLPGAYFLSERESTKEILARSQAKRATSKSRQGAMRFRSHRLGKENEASKSRSIVVRPSQGRCDLAKQVV